MLSIPVYLDTIDGDYVTLKFKQNRDGFTAANFMDELRAQLPAYADCSDKEIDVGFFMEGEEDDDDYDKIDKKGQGFNRNMKKGKVDKILIREPVLSLEAEQEEAKG